MKNGNARVVSVVTPVYNGAEFLVECIESVLSQTYGDFEYLICNNHSTDATASVIAKYAGADSRIRVVRPDHFLPQVANWNFAASHISPQSGYVKFVHADDTIEPTCIERMVSLAELHPTVGMVGSLRRVGHGDVDLDGVPPTTDVVPGRWLVRQQLSGGRYTTGSPTSTLLRREAIRGRSGVYDTRYLHADDALAYTILLDSDFGYVAEPLTFTRRHSHSTTAWCERVGTWLPEHLRMTLEFGPSVLTRDELDLAASRLEGRYVRTLARLTASGVLVFDREVRRYHRDALHRVRNAAREAGRALSPALRAYSAALARI